MTLAVFWPLRLNEFLNYDDQEYVTANSHVQRGLSWEGLVWAFRTGHAANWHPVTWLSHMLDVQLFGLNPVGHHFTNLFFHIANTMLIFLLLQQITGATWRSALVAALFALHPLHVESVAWVAERKDVLSTFFGLLSLHTYVRYAGKAKGNNDTTTHQGPRTTDRGQRAAALVSRLYFLSLLCFALALMSKPMLVTLPGVMLLMDFWPLRRMQSFTFRSPPARRSADGQDTTLLDLLIEKVPFVTLALLSSIVTLLVQQKAMLFYKSLSLPARAGNAVLSSVRYLGQALWPHRLAVLYPHPGHSPMTYVIAATALLLVVSTVALMNLHTRPYLAVGWFWFIGMLVPVLGLVQVGIQSMADRYTYLPLVGIFIMAVWAGAEVITRAKAPLWVGPTVAVALVTASAFRTWKQVQLWHDTKTLFAHAAAVTHGNWLAHYKLALVALQDYENAGRRRVEDQLSERRLIPRQGGTGGVEAPDYLAEVINQCQTALRWEPRVADVHVTHAKALTESGHLDEARSELDLAIRIDPRKADAHENLAEILYRQGRAKEAVAEYKAALALNPDWESVLNNLAWVLATRPEPELRDGAEAVRLAERACELTGQTNLWFQHTLAAAYAEKGDFAKAITAAERACQLAESSDREDLAKTAAARLNLYRSGHCLRSP
jgi:hypothetical protein